MTAKKHETNTIGPDATALPPETEAASALPPEETAPEAIAPDADPELEALRQKAAKADEHWDLYLRTRAELENYRKRATRERQDAVRYAAQALVEKLLPVLDSFEMAMAATGKAGESTLESLQQGVALVQGQLRNSLTEAGVQEINAAGELFDPNLHEAVAHQESSEVAEGHVLQQLRKGYRLHDRLVRPATVVVAKKPAQAND